MRRFCSNCGKVVNVKPISYICKYNNGEIWQAVCEKGHPFSPTYFGLSVVFVPSKTNNKKPHLKRAEIQFSQNR